VPYAIDVIDGKSNKAGQAGPISSLNRTVVSMTMSLLKNDKLPEFVVIGAMKAGTTSLHRYFSMHPEISMPRKKELNFYNVDRNWENGIDWYLSYYDLDDRKRGESCPNYSMFPTCEKVPYRMKSLIPDAKLIYIIRDPVERMLSQIHHQWVTGVETRNIDDIVYDASDSICLIRYGKYHYQLDKFLQYYSLDQILVVTLESLELRPKSTMEQVFDFIGVDKDFYDNQFKEANNTSKGARKKGLLVKGFKKIPGSRRFVNAVMPRTVLRQVKQVLTRSIDKPILTAAQEAHLIDVFEEDISKLRKLTGQSFSEWKRTY